MNGNHGVGLDRFPVRAWRELGIFVFISLVGLAIRFPFFFRAVIDWDESTFIIIGQSAVDGFLPNQIAADVKPAPVFWWFSGAIELFGKTIPSVRLAGLVWLVSSAYILYRAAFSITGSRLGSIFGAAMLIVVSSAFSLNVSSEHLAVLPMAGAILVLCRGGQRLASIFLGGCLLGLACLFRLNLVYLCLLVGIFLCVHTCRTSWVVFLRGALKKGLWFSVGLLVPIVLSLMPYLVRNRLQLGLEVYEAAVSYSDAQRSIVLNIVRTLKGSATDLVGATMWGAAIVGAFIIFQRWNDMSAERKSGWLLCGIFVLGSLLSIVMTGPVYGHYFIQLAPGLSMFAAAAFIRGGTDSVLTKVDRIKFAFGSVLIAIAVFQTAAPEWSALAHRFRAGESLSYGAEYNIANLIKAQGTENFSLFMLSNHLVYWLLGRYPPTRLATHPSNLGKPFIRKYIEPASQTTEDALRSVFLREPTFVILRPNLWYLNEDAVRFLKQQLTDAYVVVGHVGSTQIYRRIAHEGDSASESRKLDQ